jgi:hypothetical protein
LQNRTWPTELRISNKYGRVTVLKQ